MSRKDYFKKKLIDMISKMENEDAIIYLYVFITEKYFKGKD